MLVGRQELRRGKRLLSRCAARINIGDHCPLVRGVRWDIFDDGARLTASRSVENLPGCFSLVLNNAVERNCRIVRRKGRFLGIAFVDVVAP
jgi:hypothetical protein